MASAKAEALVRDTVGQLYSYEQYYGVRKRARRPDDKSIFEATVAAVVCNLAHLHLTSPGGAIAITRSNRRLGRKSRHRPPSENKTFPAVLDLMMKPEMDFLTQEMGYRNRFDGHHYHTTIRPSARFIRKLDEFPVGLEDSEGHATRKPARSRQLFRQSIRIELL